MCDSIMCGPTAFVSVGRSDAQGRFSGTQVGSSQAETIKPPRPDDQEVEFEPYGHKETSCLEVPQS